MDVYMKSCDFIDQITRLGFLHRVKDDSFSLGFKNNDFWKAAFFSQFLIKPQVIETEPGIKWYISVPAIADIDTLT